MNAPIAKYYCPPDVYDLVYADFVRDIEPHVAEARAARGPVLEACCGNGRLMIPTLEAGVACDGFDLDPDMLEDLKRKLAERGLRAGLHHADMRDFTLPRRYARVVIGFNTFGHNLTQQDQLATLRCCREHLEEGGHLSIVMFHPSVFKLVSFDGSPREVRTLPDPAGPGSVRVVDASTADLVEQINTVKRRVERLDPNGTVTATHEFEFQLRYVWKPEMELLFRLAGFPRWTVRSLFANYNAPPEALDDVRPIQEGDVLSWSAWRD